MSRQRLLIIIGLLFLVSSLSSCADFRQLTERVIENVDPGIVQDVETWLYQEGVDIEETTERAQIIARGLLWVQSRVPYNKHSYHDGYLTDSSGFVSYAWELKDREDRPESRSAATLGDIASEIPLEDIRSGDAINNKGDTPTGHTLLFVTWLNEDHTRFMALEENGGSGRAVRTELTIEALPSGGFTIEEYESSGSAPGPYYVQSSPKVTPLVSSTDTPDAEATCIPSTCAPATVLFLPGLGHGASTSQTGCLVYIDAFEEEILGGGNVRSASLIQPLRDVPFVGQAIDAVAVIQAEKWAVEVVKAANKEQSYLDAAATILVDAATDKAGEGLTGGILKFLGRGISKEKVLSNLFLKPLLNTMADRLKQNASEWVAYQSTFQSWQYAALRHCVDVGQIYCYQNYRAFLREYPQTWKYLNRSQVLSCTSP